MLIHKSSLKNGRKTTASKLITHRFTAGCVAEFLQLLDCDSKLVNFFFKISVTFYYKGYELIFLISTLRLLQKIMVTR